MSASSRTYGKLTFNVLTPHLIMTAELFAEQSQMAENRIIELGYRNREQAKEVHNQKNLHTATTFGAILASYSYIESVVNSTIHQIALDHINPEFAQINLLTSKTIFEELGRAEQGKGAFATSDVFKKIDRLLTKFLGKPSLNVSDDGYLKASALKNLRHALTHPSPEWVHDGEQLFSHNRAKNDTSTKQLCNLGLVPIDWHDSFPRMFLSAGTAKWSCDAAKAFTALFLNTADVPVEHYSSVSQQFIIPSPMLPRNLQTDINSLH